MDEGNRCTGCLVPMGPNNPRQFCKKTSCTKTSNIFEKGMYLWKRANKRVHIATCFDVIKRASEDNSIVLLPCDGYFRAVTCLPQLEKHYKYDKYDEQPHAWFSGSYCTTDSQEGEATLNDLWFSKGSPDMYRWSFTLWQNGYHLFKVSESLKLKDRTDTFEMKSLKGTISENKVVFSPKDKVNLAVDLVNDRLQSSAAEVNMEREEALAYLQCPPTDVWPKERAPLNPEFPSSVNFREHSAFTGEDFLWKFEVDDFMKIGYFDCSQALVVKRARDLFYYKVLNDGQRKTCDKNNWWPRLKMKQLPNKPLRVIEF